MSYYYYMMYDDSGSQSGQDEDGVSVPAIVQISESPQGTKAQGGTHTVDILEDHVELVDESYRGNCVQLIGNLQGATETHAATIGDFTQSDKDVVRTQTCESKRDEEKQVMVKETGGTIGMAGKILRKHSETIVLVLEEGRDSEGKRTIADEEISGGKKGEGVISDDQGVMKDAHAAAAGAPAAHYPENDEGIRVKVPIVTYERRHRPVNHTGSKGDDKHEEVVPSKVWTSCALCDKKCCTQFAMRMHMKNHIPNRKFNCKICKKGFANAFYSAVHQEVNHTSPRPLGWEASRKGYRKSDHLNAITRCLTKNKKTCMCKICGKILVDKLKLYEHERVHTGHRPFKCYLCKQGFRDIPSLKHHKHVHDEERPYKCFLCGFHFSELTLLKKHSVDHMMEGPDEWQYDILLKEVTKEEFTKKVIKTRSRLSMKNKPYECDICYKTFKQSSSLVVHRRSHTGERPFECEVCHKSFTRLDNLHCHQRVHTGAKPFTCDVCGRSFRQSSSLGKHMTVHTGEKPHACDICDRKFSQSSNLKAHQKSHLGVRPFKCTICEKSFARQFGLKVHQRTHTGEKPYECEVCHKTFAQMYFVVRHMRIHTGEKPFACEVCKKKFNQSSVLVAHMRTHTGEQPYKCDVCQKSFRQSTGLRTHRKGHKNELPFECGKCSERFLTQDAVKMHFETKMCRKLRNVVTGQEASLIHETNTV